MSKNRRQQEYPFAGLVDAVSDLSRMREAMHGQRNDSGPRSHVDAWTPTVDIAADPDDRLVIHADLAAVAEEDVDVTFSAPTLTIAGQRRLVDSDTNTYHTKELHRGQFRRTITLPDGVTREDLSLSMSRGLLTIVVSHSGQRSDRTPLPFTAAG